MMKYILLVSFGLVWVATLILGGKFLDMPQAYRLSIGVGGLLVLAALSYWVAKDK